MENKKCQISLKNLPLPPPPPPHLPLDPPTSTPYPQVNKIKKNFRYLPKDSKPRTEEGQRVVKFDHEANTEADLLADKNIVDGDGDKDEDTNICCIKHMIDSHNISINSKVKKKNSDSETDDNFALIHNHSGYEPNSVSAKSQLHEICSANSWKSPVFECFKEEGPCHQRLFTFKLTMEIEGAACLVLECFSGPRPKKKTAAEHAAEGALWYLKHLGYFPTKNKWEKRKNN